jgi:hypothetical protein
MGCIPKNSRSSAENFRFTPEIRFSDGAHISWSSAPNFGPNAVECRKNGDFSAEFITKDAYRSLRNYFDAQNITP